MLPALLDLLYPPRCTVCRAPGPETLCSLCRREFVPLSPPLCLRCGCPQSTPEPALCRQCRVGAAPFAAARSLALFSGRMRTAIHRLKFEGRRELATPLGNLLASFVCRTPALGRPERVVPVPLHPARQRARGYNHALLLAQPVARALGVPLLPHGLARVVDTVPQTALHRADRWANVTDAFRAGSEPAALCGRSILLVDDVLTSGATAAACARTLRAADAGAVYVVTVARAQPPGLTL